MRGGTWGTTFRGYDIHVKGPNFVAHDRNYQTLGNYSLTNCRGPPLWSETLWLCNVTSRKCASRSFPAIKGEEGGAYQVPSFLRVLSVPRSDLTAVRRIIRR